MSRCLTTCWVIATLGLGVWAAGPAPPPGAPPGGPVVEGLARSRSAGAPPAEVGDRLEGWRPRTGGGGWTAFRCAFEVQWLEFGLAPVSPLALHVGRGDTTVEWTMPPWRWGFFVRPALSPESLELLTRSREGLGGPDAATARASLERLAAELARAGRPEDGAWVLAVAGEKAGKAGDAAGSDALFAAAVATASRVSTGRPRAWVERMWALSLKGQRRGPEAVEAFGRALGALDGDDRGGLLEAHLQDQRALVLYDLGSNGPAEEGDRRALEIRRARVPGSPVLAGSLVNMGLTLRTRGDWAEAERMYREALAIFQVSDPGSGVVAQVLNNLGTVAYLRGDLASAERYDLQALEIRELLSAGTLDVARSLNNLGAVAKERRDWTSAERHYRRALALSLETAPDGVETASILDNLSQVLQNQGGEEEAAALCGRALEIYAEAAPESLERSRTLTTYASVLVDLGRLEEAEAVNAQAAALKEKLLPGSLSRSYNEEVSAQVLLARGDLAGAEACLARACATRDRLAPGTTDHCEALHQLAGVQRRLGQSRAAAQTLDRALALLEEHEGRLGGGQEEAQGFAAGFSDLYRDRVDLLCEEGDFAGALAVLERYHAQSLLALLAGRDIDFGADAPAALLARQRQLRRSYDGSQEELAGLSPTRDADQVAALLERMADLRRERSRLAEEVRRASPRYAAITYPQPLGAAEAAAALPAGAALLAFSTGPERTWVIGLSRGGAWGYAVPLSRRRMAQEVSALRALCADPTTGIDAVRARGQALFRKLLGPASGRLPQGRGALLLCADGPLHVLPWAALHDGRRYLVETSTAFSVPSATAFALTRAAPSGPPSARPLIAFADPEPPPRAALPGGGVEVLPRLPAAREEVGSIGRLFGARARIFLGAEATETRAWAEGAGARYLHFACHGLLDPLSPLDSSLALAPGGTGPGGDNGLLQAWEVFERCRLDADLVTLSACETGLGQDRGGEGVVGLARAFQYAGGRAVLSTLWSVADSSTSVFMSSLYEELLRGRSPAAALARAQRMALRERGGGRAHPFFWSGFVLDGRGDGAAPPAAAHDTERGGS